MPDSVILGGGPLCRLCGHVQMKTLVIPEQRLGLGTPFRYGVCRRCRLVQLLDPPPDMETYYRNYSYHRRGGHGERNFLAHAHEQLVGLLMRPMRRYVPPERDKQLAILDVGCARGQFLHELQQQGFNTLQGIEVSEEAVRNKIDESLNVECASLANWNGEGPFDLITLNQVFEHFEDPLRMLTKLRELLSKDGMLVMSFPNYNSLARWIFRSYWPGYDAPRHFFTYTPRNITALCLKSGLRVARVKYVSRPSQFLGSLQYMFNDFVRKKQPLETGFFRNAKLLDLMLFIPCYLLNIFHWGDMIEVYAKKDA